jgi:hypothetical protein
MRLGGSPAAPVIFTANFGLERLAIAERNVDRAADAFLVRKRIAVDLDLIFAVLVAGLLLLDALLGRLERIV